MKTNASIAGYSIRGYTPGDVYATIYCPHGKPIEVINTAHKPIDPATELAEWMSETSEWRDTYCHH